MTMAIRLAKIAMAGRSRCSPSLSCSATLLTTAPFAFVQHVLSMDTTSLDTAPRWRAITSPVLWHASYWVVILGEALTCAAYTIGTVSLARNLRGSSAEFNSAKSAVYVASALGFLVWFLGLMVIGGEWFAMWQSNTWNGQEAAFRFYAAILCVGIFIALDDGNHTS